MSTTFQWSANLFSTLCTAWYSSSIQELQKPLCRKLLWLGHGDDHSFIRSLPFTSICETHWCSDRQTPSRDTISMPVVRPAQSLSRSISHTFNDMAVTGTHTQLTSCFIIFLYPTCFTHASHMLQRYSQHFTTTRHNSPVVDGGEVWWGSVSMPGIFRE